MLTNDQVKSVKAGSKLRVSGEKRSFVGVVVRFSPEYMPPAFGLKEDGDGCITSWYETNDPRMSIVED